MSKIKNFKNLCKILNVGKAQEKERGIIVAKLKKNVKKYNAIAYHSRQDRYSLAIEDGKFAYFPNVFKTPQELYNKIKFYENNPNPIL